MTHECPTWAVKGFAEPAVVGWSFVAGMHPSAVAERFARDELAQRSEASGTTWHVVVSANTWAPSVPAARYELELGAQGLRNFRRVA